jgi:hypothetical protein
MPEYVLDLRNAIKKATPLLKNIADDVSRRPRSPGKWKHHLNQLVKLD